MNILKALMFTAVVMIFISAADLTFTQEKQPPSSMGQMKSMEKMPMDTMIKKCSEHHQVMTKSVDQLSKTLEAAKQSNDRGKMRAAIDQTQKQLF